MGQNSILDLESVIAFIESHLADQLDLETVSKAVHYSKYHLHRRFRDAVGMTIDDYVLRRRLTEGAKLLVFSEKPILELALICGYESQAAFTAAFKAMYKLPPAEYRRQREFYPLQLRFTLHGKANCKPLSKAQIRFATQEDAAAWMELVCLSIDGYPHLDETAYHIYLGQAINENRALVLYQEKQLIGALAVSYETGSIDFLGVHPQYRNKNIQKLFLDCLLEDILPGREISITTYRSGDRADTGYRKELQQLGFSERELLVEFGYPTQRFVYPP